MWAEQSQTQANKKDGSLQPESIWSQQVWSVTVLLSTFIQREESLAAVLTDKR